MGDAVNILFSEKTTTIENIPGMQDFVLLRYCCFDLFYINGYLLSILETRRKNTALSRF